MPNRKQLKFYRYLVVDSVNYAVYPAANAKEAEDMARELATQYGAPDRMFMVDARWNDDARLFWSGTQVGHPLT